jgi:hypothetical protein
MFPEVLGEAMEKAGFQFVPDPMDLSADATKVIKIQDRQQTEGIRLVQEVQFSDSDSDTSAD